MRARALVRVPREPVRALAFLAAVARAVDAWDGRMSTTAAVGERSREQESDSPTMRTRPFFALFRPIFAPRLLQRLPMPRTVKLNLRVINFFCFNEVFFGVAQVPPSPPSTKGL